jgi:hypothetical protein
MSCYGRLGIRWVPALSCILAAAPAGAQVVPDAQALYKACMSDAANGQNAIQTGDRKIYTCWGSVAQNYFDYLVSKNATQTIDKQRTGTYIFRAIPQPQAGRCWNKIQSADGIPSSTFGCSINVSKLAN